MSYWLKITKQTSLVIFIWSIIWVIISYYFIGGGDKLQIWASVISLIFSLYAVIVLFYYYPNYDRTFYLHYVAWATLFLIFLLELIFLITLLSESNDYDVEKTEDHTYKAENRYTVKEITLMFIMGIVAILSLLVVSVASFRLKNGI